MISANSRYRTATVTTATGPDGLTRQEMRVAFPRARRITYTYHRVLSGERGDTLAFRYYGNGSLWWMIADANPEILDWLELPPGQVLRIPDA